jgi:hypothetical protein
MYMRLMTGEFLTSYGLDFCGGSKTKYDPEIQELKYISGVINSKEMKLRQGVL